MDKVVIANGANIIGRRGENEAVRLLFPISPWKEQFGDGGTFQLVAQRHNDAAPYPVAIEVDDRYVYWTVNAADTAVVGNGTCELYYFIDDVLAKSVIYITLVFESMDEPGEAPEPQIAWLEQVLGYATDAEVAAVDAAASATAAAGSAGDAFDSANAAAASAAETASYSAHPPIIGVNFNWWIWNGAEYVDSGHSSMATTYTHTQYSASSEWTINHNLNRYPSVTVVDSAGTKAYGDVTYIDADTLTVSFNAPFSGTAYLN